MAKIRGLPAFFTAPPTISPGIPGMVPCVYLEKRGTPSVYLPR